MDRRLIYAVSALVLLVIGYGILLGFRNNQPEIKVQTDKTPVKLEIGSEVYTISKPEKSIRLPEGSYNYRAAYGSGANAIKLYGTVNPAKGKDAEQILLNYKAFSKDAIVQSLCALNGPDAGTKDCPYANAVTKITYYSDFSWAIVNLNLPGPESDTSLVALQYDNGAWDKAAGPVSNPREFQGSIPEVVLGSMTP
jgi:hypothetical protein